jgi:ribosomal protein L11 methyltransferase
MSARFHRLLLQVLEENEDRLAAWLWSHGTAGIEFRPGPPGSSVLVASFEEEKLPAKGDLGDLAAFLPGVELLDSGAIADTDWLAAWRTAAQPIPLGDRLVVDPREWDAESSPGPGVAPSSRTHVPGAAGAQPERFVLQIPARTAFGVGSHESTRLAYELLEATPLAGKRVLDVGCGSGILSMAALLLGARAAVGFDLDLAAAFLAGQYARQNGLAPAIFTGTVAALAAPAAAKAAPAFDVVVLNVLPHEIRDELEQVVAQLADGGDLLVSGVLATEAAAVIQEIERHHCRRTGELHAGEWIGLRFEKRQARAPEAR